MSDTPVAVPPRQHGKRGRRPIRNLPQLRLSRFKDTAPPAPPSGDVTQDLTDWGMLGNDTYGCCGPAAFQHGRMAKALQIGADGTQGWEAGFAPPTTEDNTGLYFAYGKAMGEPGDQPDQGVDNALLFKYLKDQGLVELFAQIDPSDVNELHRAMIDFKGVLVGICLTAAAESEFDNHQPWTVTAQEQPKPDQGHDILLVKYGPEGDTFVTWGALQLANVDWINAESSSYMDAWVFFTKEDAARVGVDAAALEAEINSLPSLSASHASLLGGVIDKAREVVQSFSNTAQEAAERLGAGQSGNLEADRLTDV